MNRLVRNWRFVTRKAWSIRLSILAAILSGLEVVTPLFADSMPRNLFASLAVAVAISAAIARVVAQEGFDD